LGELLVFDLELFGEIFCKKRPRTGFYTYIGVVELEELLKKLQKVLKTFQLENSLETLRERLA